MSEAAVRTRAWDPPHMEVLYELGAAEHALRAAVEARLPAPMSFTHFEVLRDFLRFGDGAAPAEIASRLRITRGAETHMLQRMETLGWIRLAGDDRDGRRKQVFMTPEGAEMARAATAALSAASLLGVTSVNLDTFECGAAGDSFAVWHVPVLPVPEVYGYCDSSARPFFSANVKALSMAPPLQPESTLSHETSSCSESDSSTPSWRKMAPSIAPVAEKAQHEPHCAWFLIGVTAPLVVQSMSSGTVTFCSVAKNVLARPEGL